MIQNFVKRFELSKPALRAVFSERHPENYRAIVEAVVGVLHDGWGTPDPKRVHEIDDGEYQGVLVYVIAESEYQPSTYWYVCVDYGSCSGCDTLERIRDDVSERPTTEQVEDYLTLAMHVVQGLKEMLRYSLEDVAGTPGAPGHGGAGLGTARPVVARQGEGGCDDDG